MITVTFAKAFRRHVECPDESIDPAGATTTLGDVLAGYFERRPAVRGYVVDDRGSLRRHVTVFVGDDQVAHAGALATDVPDGATVHIFQALSGG
jgi:hypothetical protein